MNMSDTDYDYIVVGSGAGGGPLAANLATAGFKVLVLEAGGDPCSEEGNDKGRLMYEVPGFHGDSTEYSACAWNYYVRHYTNDAQQAKDTKKVKKEGNLIWYPRAGTLGGCTSHNAMITVIPQDSDWDNIAKITKDDSWRADKMRPYFARLEDCQYVPPPDAPGAFAREVVSSIAELFGVGEDWRDQTHGHGFKGWLKTSEADPKLLLKDNELIISLLKAAQEVLHDQIGNPLIGLRTRFDPNDSRYTDGPEGLVFTPLAVANGKRNGPRD